MKQMKIIAITLVFLLLIAFAALLFVTPMPPTEIVDYAETHSIFSLSDVYDFEWEVVYNDRSTAGSGERVKKEYGLNFYVRSTSDDMERRLFFINDGRMVKAYTYNALSLVINSDEHIYPDTLFHAIWNEGKTQVTLYEL